MTPDLAGENSSLPLDEGPAETVPWGDIPRDVQIEILRELGYSVEENRILDAAGVPVLDKYTKAQVRLDNLMIVWGSTLLLDNNYVSIASYFEEYGEQL